LSTLSEDIGAFAPGHRLEHNGNTYMFRHLTLSDLAAFERENFRARREALRAMRDDYGEEAWLVRLDDLRRDFDRHRFAIENDPEAVKSISGILLVLRLMLQVGDDEINTLFRERQAELLQLMNLTLRESFPRTLAKSATESGEKKTTAPS